MAENNCTYRNPLIRDGVSQIQRMPEALDPGYVNIDERDLADLLRFVIRYSELLQYYKLDNTPDGNWKLFFEQDMTSIIVMVTGQNPNVYVDCIEKMEEIIKDGSATLNDVRNALKTLFDLTATLSVEIDHWYRKSVEGFDFRSHLERVITSDLRPSLKKLAGFYKGAFVGTDLIDEGFVAGRETCGKELVSFPDLGNKNLHSVWIDPAADETARNSWQDFYRSVDSDTSVYKTDSMAVKARVQEGLPVIRDLAKSFVRAVQTTKQYVPEFVEESLKSFSAHESHLGLLLAFFQLFRHAQDQMNTLPRRHLNFYYEKVLQLARNDAVPDQVHLITELAKHVESYRIAEGTLFKAGKDALGKEVLYRAKEEAVLNKASIAQLKSIFIDRSDQYRIYEKPVADSADGLGKEMEKPSDGWNPFGESQLLEVADNGKKYRPVLEATMQFSAVGFAIASPVLELAEGERDITIDISCAGNSFENSSQDLVEGVEYTDLLEFYATGPEGWINLQEFDFTSVIVRNGSEYTITLTLPREVPPVTGYDEKWHGSGYQTVSPVLRIILANNRNTGPYLYGVLRNKTVDKLDLSISVRGMKDLVIQNELGLLDPAKPFQPFGSAPATGSTFYIGKREVFSKNLDTLSVEVEWHDYPEQRLGDYYNYDENGIILGSKYTTRTPLGNSDFKADVEILTGGRWKPVKNNISIFPSQLGDEFELIRKAWSGTGTGDESNNFAIGWAPETTDFTGFDVGLNRGFIRLILSAPQSAFGHKFYARLLMQQLQADNEIPVEPYTPKIKSIKLDYSASISLNISGEETNTGFDQLYHIYPFGALKSWEGEQVSDDLFLLPRFVHDGKIGDIDHEGEFFIGISELNPPRQLSMLFKMADGSGNPLLIPPEITWFYLSEKGWRFLKKENIVSDATHDFLDTGIVKVNIPADACSETSLLPDNLYWLKAAINKNSGALSRIIAIHTQAIPAEFEDQGNDPGFPGTVLPAGTISKLKTKEASVKKIEQPYASEGGRPAERDTEYYRRVSERLRHKERGITVWDYERLVLQQFPSVYKAKCINHSVYGLDNDGVPMDAEFAPGYVTVVVVPDLKKKNAFNVLKPRVSLNLIKKIECFLKQNIPVFAAENLKVINPLFEQIQVAFNVTFVANKNEGFYQSKLAEDITAFLSPWAFEEGKEIAFGGTVHKSVILNFVEERPYVDFVTDFTMHHHIEDQLVGKDVNEISAREARSVLVSYSSHNINNQAISVS